MILANGVPPILGIGLVHVLIINVMAIFVEYNFAKKRLRIKLLFIRVLLANLISVCIGFMVIVLVPELLGGDTSVMEKSMNNFDRLTFIAGLIGMFISNLLIEFPFYISSGMKDLNELKRTFTVVLVANAWTNVPVFIFYGLLMA